MYRSILPSDKRVFIRRHPQGLNSFWRLRYPRYKMGTFVTAVIDSGGSLRALHGDQVFVDSCISTTMVDIAKDKDHRIMRMCGTI